MSTVRSQGANDGDLRGLQGAEPGALCLSHSALTVTGELRGGGRRQWDRDGERQAGRQASEAEAVTGNPRRRVSEMQRHRWMVRG